MSPRADQITRQLTREAADDRSAMFEGFHIAKVVVALPPPKGPMVELTKAKAWKGISFGPAFVLRSCLISVQLLASTKVKAGPGGYMDLNINDSLGVKRGEVEASVEKPSAKGLNLSGVPIQSAVYALLLNKRVLVYFLDGDPDEPIIFDIIEGGGMFRSDDKET